MKTISRNSFLRFASLLVALLAVAALASAQSQIVLAGGSQGVTLDAINARSAQVSFGTCNRSICSMSGTGAVLNSTGSAVSAGIWSLALHGGPLTVSNTGAFNRSPTGTFTFNGETGMTGGSLAAMLPRDSSTELRYRLGQVLCSSSGTESCKFQSRFNNSGTPARWWRGLGSFTPSEPVTAFLVGTGLLGISVLLRRRLKLTHTEANQLVVNSGSPLRPSCPSPDGLVA